MTRNNLLRLGSHAFTGFCISFGLTAGLATALSLQGSLPLLGVLCALAAVILSLCFAHRHGIWCFAGILLFLPFSAFWEQLRDIGRVIFRNLNLGYGITVPGFFLQEPPQTHFLPLLFLGLLICGVTLWVISRQGSCSWVALLSLAMLLPCVLVIDTVPASFPLGLWLTGMILLLLTQELRRRDKEQALRLFGILLVPVILAVFALFWFLPRGTSPQLPSIDTLLQIELPWLTNNQPNILTGKNQIDLSTLKKPSQRDNVVMTVTGPYTGKLYLRGRSYDRYNGQGWTSTEELYEHVPDLPNSRSFAITVDSRLPLDQFFIPYAPNDLQISSAVALKEGHMENPHKQQQYSFRYTIQPGAAALDSRGDQSYYTQLPDATWQALREKNPTFTTANPILTAQEIGTYVSRLVPYDINAEAFPRGTEDFAVWFLQEAESGFCVHYATVATVLLRYYGIPARYVEGYTVYVEDGTSAVPERAAHAWVEYYVAGHGWKVLDPTPGDPAAEIPDITVPTTAVSTQSATTAPPQPTATAPATTPSTQVTTQPASSEVCTQPGVCVPPNSQETPAWLLPLLLWVFGIVFTVAAFFGQWAARRYTANKAMTTGTPNAQALARYREYLRRLKFLKQPELPEVTALAQKAKFSQHTLTPEDLQCLDRHLATARADLLELSLPGRFIAKWILALY